MGQRRVVGMYLVAIASVLIIAAVLPRGWWSMVAGDETVNIGLRSVEICETKREWDSSYEEPSSRKLKCTERDLADVFKKEHEEDEAYYDEEERRERQAARDLGAFTIVGTLAFVSGLALAVFLGVLAGLAHQATTRRLARNLTTIGAIGSAAFGALSLLFLLLRPDQFGPVPWGTSPMLALLGAGIGLFGSRQLAGYEPSMEPRLAVVKSSRVPGLVVAGVAAALMLASTMALPWWKQTRGEGTMTMNPRSFEECDKDRCDGASIAVVGQSGFDNDKGGNKFFAQMGGFLFHLSLIGAVVALVALALIGAGRQPLGGGLSPPPWLLTIGSVFLVCTLLFIGSKPEFFKEMKMTFGVVAAFLGGGGLVAGGIMLMKWKPPPEDGLGFDPIVDGNADRPAGTLIPACPTCTAPMVWTEEHKRFFCAKCRVYV